MALDPIQEKTSVSNCKPNFKAQQWLTQARELKARYLHTAGARWLSEGIQRHQAADDILPLDTCLSSSLTSQERDDKRQTSINAGQTASQRDKPCEKIKKWPSCRRGSGKAYNLRPLLVKRPFPAEQEDGESDEKLVKQHKRRKYVTQPEKRGSRQGSELTQNRKERFLRKSKTKRSYKASAANT